MKKTQQKEGSQASHTTKHCSDPDSSRHADLENLQVWLVAACLILSSSIFEQYACTFSQIPLPEELCFIKLFFS